MDTNTNNTGNTGANVVAKPNNVREITLSPVSVSSLIKEIRKDWHKNKVGLEDIKNALAIPNALDNDIVDVLTRTFDETSDEDATELYKQCDRTLKSNLLIPDKEVNLSLYYKVGADGVEIARAFLTKKKLSSPNASAYSTHFTDLVSDDALTDLVHMLKGLQASQAKKILGSMGPKVLYLLAAAEIDIALQEDPQGGEELFCALELGDIIPPAFSFLGIVQEKAPDIFMNLIREVNNQDWDEFRDMFYELQSRNQTLVNQIFEKESVNSVGYLNQLLGDD
jgi:hypothetical protein